MATKKAAKKKSSSSKSSAKKSSSKKSSSRKYSPSAGKNVETEMHEMKKGKLKSGRSGKKVTKPETGDRYWSIEGAQGREKGSGKEVIGDPRYGIIDGMRTVARSS